MPDQQDLLKAIRVIVREENQAIRDDVLEVKEDVRELNQRVGKLEEKVDRLETKADVLEEKVDNLPGELITIIAEPLAKEQGFLNERVTRIEKHNHLPPLQRPE